MARLTFDLSISLDGFVAGPSPSDEHPLGEGGEQLHEWAVATKALFGDDLSEAPRQLECTSIVASPTGVAHCRYRVV
jgi:hypothetical protein